LGFVVYWTSCSPHTLGEHADQYTTKPNIYHTLGEHAVQYTTKPNIYHTLGEPAVQYTTKPNIYHTLGEPAESVVDIGFCGVLVSMLT
jgi:hypothetical protein